MHRPALACLALAVAALALPSCSQTCTAIGCVDGLDFVFDEEIPLDYTVTVEIGGRTGTRDCTAATVEAGATETSGPLTGELDDVVTCSTTFLRIAGSPPEATIAIVYADGTRTDASARPAYEESHPNGEDCEPTCYNAEIEIDAHKPG
jgi:hypothetical protein